MSAFLRERWTGLRSGDLGAVIVGLAAIVAFFTAKNGNFFTAANFDNLIVQLAGTATIAIGVVYVLLLGEVDLSIGYTSGVAGVVVAELQLPASGHQLPGLIAILLAVVTGVVIGAFQGSFVALIGVPSFVVTLAGLIAFQGVIIKALPQGVIVLQDKYANDIANYYFSDLAGWIIAAAVTGSYLTARARFVIGRRREGIATPAWWLELARATTVAGVAFGVVAIANDARGLPFAGLLVAVLFIAMSYLATRTTSGRMSKPSAGTLRPPGAPGSTSRGSASSSSSSPV